MASRPERCALVLRYESQRRELAVGLDTTLLDVRILAAHLFELALPTSSKELPWDLTYVDNEGDVVHLTNDMELQEAFTMPALTITVQAKRNLLESTINQHVLPAVQSSLASMADWFTQLTPEHTTPRRPSRAESETESESDDDDAF
ncbi:hypothetical protein SPRG_10421 [Saprolegnia parasitica CBS 223.65]|uniref:PB1 domain-containing protein n=1 Tax=Saprolegnia parasitica (strain CBS 223.65) TaxID=695850 RepID=A0A067C0P0_SAPPC|nr:hypothetical protein SPRG_10421 [Saprolegnia parasitica CBS 223.65]KDO24344.1 hypothetical protein SPRG_10421 [Saprolegnia parasitica CBS 223.65]|eukprot:XP_012204939.1 hypothetical protein SPRG_10421 [Saprolegnia parasitica CBS 223.65]